MYLIYVSNIYFFGYISTHSTDVHSKQDTCFIEIIFIYFQNASLISINIKNTPDKISCHIIQVFLVLQSKIFHFLL